MKFFLLFSVCVFVIVIANGQSSNENLTWKGRWTERQTERGAVEWLFQGKDKFAKIDYWGAFELGGKIHKGTFHIDTLNKMVLLKFDKVIDIKNDTILWTGYHEEWKIVSMDNDELVLSRRTLFSTDKPNKSGDKDNIYVRLKRTIIDAYYEPTASVN